MVRSFNDFMTKRRNFEYEQSLLTFYRYIVFVLVGEPLGFVSRKKVPTRHDYFTVVNFEPRNGLHVL